MSIDLKENLMIEKIKKNDICQNLLKLHRNNIEVDLSIIIIFYLLYFFNILKRIQNENSEFLEKINKTNENNIFLKKHITFLEDSILYLEKILEELNEKIIKFWTQRFETYNEIFLKNLKEKKKTNQKIIQTLKFETQELRLMYEKRIDMKEQEIKMISENYKKRLYERFNAKVSFGMEEIENKEQTWIKENEKKAKKEEGNELKMKLIERETKLKKKQRRGNRKENLEEFNSKFYHLRK